MLGYTSILKECVHFTYKTQPNVTMGTSLVAQTKESVCNVGELDSIPGLGRSLGWEDPLEKGNGNPLQFSCLENSMDRGA